MASTQVLKLEDPEGGQLYVTRIEDVGYALALVPSYDEDGNPQPFRLLDDKDRDRLRSFLSRIG